MVLTAVKQPSTWLILVWAAFLLSPVQVGAANRILDNSEVELADAASLSAEAEVFKSIGLGISLSLASCADQQGCALNVDRDEIQHLLDTLDNRIDGLVVRQESGEEDFTEVLTAYVNERENYQRFLDQLGEVGPPEMPVETVTEEAPQLVEEPAGEVAAEAVEEEFELFEDVGEGIIEDEEIQDELPYEDTESQ